MKMAKASEKDMEAALEMCRALDVLEDGMLPDEITNGEDSVYYDAEEHAEKVVDHLMSIFKKASLFRVCFGMTVVLDPENEIVDPDADTLEVHPRFVRMAAQRDELLEILKEAKQHILPFGNNVEISQRIDSAIKKTEMQS